MRAFDAAFDREHGCTLTEWIGWLPSATYGHALRLGEGGAEVLVGAGMLRLTWQVLAPRRIALLNLPRLHVTYAFTDVDADERARFMKRFDLYIQRGGG